MTTSEDKHLPIIGITMGDPAGIGPEIVINSLNAPGLFDICDPIIIGDHFHLDHIAEDLGSAINFSRFGDSVENGSIQIFDLDNIEHEELRLGEESAMTGRASANYIEAAVDLWKTGKIDAIATAPISKNALKLAGYNYPGHTEFLAELTGTEEFRMSFFGGHLRVVLVSTHLPLREALEKVTKDELLRLIRFSDRQFERLLGRKVKIAVAGLNPHASEGGMFGSEEAERITPAIEECLREGIDVSGPYSPDTIFLRGHKGEFDVVVACYHDQATIAVKSLAFGSAVNVTLGLPLIRTSVDHGTAFDIAEKFIADESSMLAAIKLAAELAKLQKKSQNTETLT
ncbi:MAG: 4-hydroxythreonine-4-phosphate dehydrogenase PdxA [Acidobacteria bacterium]|nr:4-hydroxythreonine-4-phosphate dehydrogenase PdxA [Acidobacteriota bacterium]